MQGTYIFLAILKIQVKTVTSKMRDTLRVKLYFCPVGTAFSSDYIEISDVYNGSVKANDLTKDEILHTANAYSNHGGEIIYRVSYHRVTEDWNN